MGKQILGKKVRDTVTDMVGTATGVAHYLTGSSMVYVAIVSSNGEYKEVWIDEGRIEIIGD